MRMTLSAGSLVGLTEVTNMSSQDRKSGERAERNPLRLNRRRGSMAESRDANNRASLQNWREGCLLTWSLPSSIMHDILLHAFFFFVSCPRAVPTAFCSSSTGHQDVFCAQGNFHLKPYCKRRLLLVYSVSLVCLSFWFCFSQSTLECQFHLSVLFTSFRKS